MKFSVLISSYYKDDPDELREALHSIWDAQTLKPAEIVIVKDGPLSTELDLVIDDFAKTAPVKIIPLVQNLGLGLALAEGILHCSHSYVARMDGDDISVFNRFEKQLSFMCAHPEVDICGGMIEEFANTPTNVIGKRVLPENHNDIVNFLKKRSPFNHMTVMYKKEIVISAGNYLHFSNYEDYWLWARIIVNGGRCANLPDVLVKVRAGDNMLFRRKGWKFFIKEFEMAFKLKQLGVLTRWEAFCNAVLRGTVRLLPVFFLRMVYRKLREK